MVLKVTAMDAKYRYGHRPGRRRRTRVLIVMAVSLLILGIIRGIIGYDLYKHRAKSVTGINQTIIQSFDENANKLIIDEPTYTMELPSDWKQIDKQTANAEHSITWRATKANQDNRYLKLYVDSIPSKSVNKLLPLTSQGARISFGDLSDNCATFTKTNAQDTDRTQAGEVSAKWEKIDFICDLPRPTDNEVGTGSLEGLNTITVSGSKAGAHKYFFVYTDRNIQPDYSIFYNALTSFKAK
jgi:hypothetical protein